MKPGDEIEVRPVLGMPGVQSYRRVDEAGGRYCGLLGDVSVVGAEATGVVTCEHVEGRRYRVREAVQYNARGSTGAVSNAYRSGWDAVFGAREWHARGAPS